MGLGQLKWVIPLCLVWIAVFGSMADSRAATDPKRAQIVFAQPCLASIQARFDRSLGRRMKESSANSGSRHPSEAGRAASLEGAGDSENSPGRRGSERLERINGFQALEARGDLGSGPGRFLLFRWDPPSEPRTSDWTIEWSSEGNDFAPFASVRALEASYFKRIEPRSFSFGRPLYFKICPEEGEELDCSELQTLSVRADPPETPIATQIARNGDSFARLKAPKEPQKGDEVALEESVGSEAFVERSRQAWTLEDIALVSAQDLKGPRRYRFRTINGDLQSTYSEILMVAPIPLAALPVPSELKLATIDSNKLRLSWKCARSTEITGFVIERSFGADPADQSLYRELATTDAEARDLKIELDAAVAKQLQFLRVRARAKTRVSIATESVAWPDKPNSDTWVALNPNGPASVSSLYLRVIKPMGTKILVQDAGFAGANSSEVYIYDSATDLWSHSSGGAPLNGTTQVWTGTDLYSFGGSDGNTIPYSSLYLLDQTTGNFVRKADAPGPLRLASGVWTGSRLLVVGGLAQSDPCLGYSTALYSYDPSKDSWEVKAGLDTVRIKGRAFASAVWTGSKMVMWGGSLGGCGDFFPNPNGAMYDPALDQWTLINSTGAGPSMGFDPIWGGAPGIWTGSRMLLWDGVTATGALFDPAANAWTAMSTAGAPTPRTNIGLAWNGKVLMAWGGQSPSSTPLNTGAIYDPSVNAWIKPTAVDAHTPSPGARTIIWSGSRFIVSLQREGDIKDTFGYTP